MQVPFPAFPTPHTVDDANLAHLNIGFINKQNNKKSWRSAWSFSLGFAASGFPSQDYSAHTFSPLSLKKLPLPPLYPGR